MQHTNWRPIGAWNYEVSDDGRVRNAKTRHVLTPMRTGAKRPGAQRSKVRVSSTPRVDIDVAHAVLTAFVCLRPSGAVAMHKDDNSANNCVTNLSWGTPAENAKDCARKQRGGTQRLTAEQCADILERRIRGEAGVALAREYGVSQQRVCDIFKGRSTLVEARHGYGR